MSSVSRLANTSPSRLALATRILFVPTRLHRRTMISDGSSSLSRHMRRETSRNMFNSSKWAIKSGSRDRRDSSNIRESGFFCYSLIRSIPIEISDKGLSHRPSLSPHISMIAGGTGITPMLQIINAALKNPSDKTTLALVYANVEESDIRESPFSTFRLISTDCRHSFTSTPRRSRKARIRKPLALQILPSP